MVKTGVSAEIKKRAKACKDRGFLEFIKSNEYIIRFGPSQTSLRMINKVLTSEKVPLAMKKSNLSQKTIQILKETALNEVQITIWACLLERLTLNNSKFSLWFRLLGCALYSKELLGDSVDYLLQKYAEKDEGFLQNYGNWRSICNKVNIDLRDIIKKYSEISTEKTEKIDYNYYVDDIVFGFQPYKKEKKSKISENLEDSDLDFFADLDPTPMKDISGCSDWINEHHDSSYIKIL